MHLDKDGAAKAGWTLKRVQGCGAEPRAAQSLIFCVFLFPALRLRIRSCRRWAMTTAIGNAVAAITPAISAALGSMLVLLADDILTQIRPLVSVKSGAMEPRTPNPR